MLKWKEKSPGLKILWIWTFGTAAILVASTVRTRIRDMENLLNAEEAVRSESSDLAAASGDEVLGDK